MGEDRSPKALGEHSMNRVKDSDVPGQDGSLKSDHPGQHVGILFYVDDDAFVRSSVARRLIRRGYLVREFDSGEAVVACLQDQAARPDVILLDYKMPGMDGLETFQEIRHLSSHTPVILFTAYSGAFNVEEVKRQGLFDVLTKNVELDNIIQVIQLAIAQKKEHPSP